MKQLKEFIEVTSIYDGKKALIRAACIDAVIDNAAEVKDFNGRPLMVKPAYRTVNFSGGSLDVAESLEEISEMIYSAEL